MDTLLQWLKTYPDLAWMISIAVNVGVALLGLVPSVFVTAANIAMWGFASGTALSLVGESLGAVLAFYVYRLGWKRAAPRTDQWPMAVQKLLGLAGWEAAKIVVGLRIMPFMPSGLVTLAAAISRISITLFAISSTIGKIPALLIEGLAVSALFVLPLWAQILSSIILGAALYVYLTRRPYESPK